MCEKGGENLFPGSSCVFDALEAGHHFNHRMNAQQYTVKKKGVEIVQISDPKPQTTTACCANYLSKKV
jgi:hypothetical protein